MRPVDFPHSSEFVEKIRARLESVRRKKVSDQLTLIGEELESFDENCDSDGCLRIAGPIIGTERIYEEVLQLIENNGWLVHYDKNADQYIFSIEGLSSPNEV